MKGDEKPKPSTVLRKDVRLNREDVHLHLSGDEECPWKVGGLQLALSPHSSLSSSPRHCSSSGSCSTS